MPTPVELHCLICKRSIDDPCEYRGCHIRANSQLYAELDQFYVDHPWGLLPETKDEDADPA